MNNHSNKELEEIISQSQNNDQDMNQVYSFLYQVTKEKIVKKNMCCIRHSNKASAIEVVVEYTDNYTKNDLIVDIGKIYGPPQKLNEEAIIYENEDSLLEIREKSKWDERKYEPKKRSEKELWAFLTVPGSCMYFYVDHCKEQLKKGYWDKKDIIAETTLGLGVKSLAIDLLKLNGYLLAVYYISKCL